jgi:hypothetical protein
VADACRAANRRARRRVFPENGDVMRTWTPGWARGRAAAVALLTLVALGGCRLFDLDIEKCGPEFRATLAGGRIVDANGADLGAYEIRLTEERNPTVYRMLWVFVGQQGGFGAPLRGKIESIKLLDATISPASELFTFPLDAPAGGDELIATQQIVYPEFLDFEEFKSRILAGDIHVEFRTTLTNSEQFTVQLTYLRDTDWDRADCVK